MKKTLSILFSALAIIYTLYVVFLGFTNPDSIHYTQMYIMCALMTAASLFIIFGAFESIDQERAGK
jgi:hypothetical protein